MRRAVIAAAAGSLLLPAAAQAHVSIHPNTLPAGSNPTLEVRIPNEQDNARTVKVDMQVPPGFVDATTQLPAGWKVSVRHTKLAKPVKTDDGTVTEQVSEIIWTASGGGGIPPESFQQFPVLTAIPDADAGKTLTFKVLQTYSNGQTTRWIEPAGSEEHPAPTVNVTAKGGALQDVAGTEAGPGPAKSAAAATPAKTASTTKGASKGLGIAALIVGIVALLVALAGVALVRRPRGAGA
jgi:uncharacterized protein YcnI